MKHFAICLLNIGAVALGISANADAKPKQKVKLVIEEAEPAPPPRIPGYAVLAMDNNKRDKLRVTEGEARATIPNIMANDVDYITVVGANTVVTVYQDANFRGHSLTLRCGNYELLQQPRNDIESVRVSYVKKTVSECQGSDRELVQYTTWDK